MPIFVEWKWMDKTETFLAIFHFWDDGERENLRMRLEEEGFEVCEIIEELYEEEKGEWAPLVTLPYYARDYPKTDAYLSWAPAHAEFCLLTEVLTYANLINGLKPFVKKKLRPRLEGRIRERDRYLEIDSKLFHLMPRASMVSFAGQEGISFEVRLEYIEYLRKLLRPYLRS